MLLDWYAYIFVRLVQFVKVDVKNFEKPESKQERAFDKLTEYLLTNPKFTLKWNHEKDKNEASKDETKPNHEKDKNEEPKLLMSVLGGAWDFPVSNHVKETFHKGIVNAADSSSKFSSSIWKQNKTKRIYSAQFETFNIWINRCF